MAEKKVKKVKKTPDAGTKALRDSAKQKPSIEVAKDANTNKS